jgi:hypothetical protein
LPVSSVSEPLGAARCPSCRALIDLESSRSISARPKNVPVPEKWQVDAKPGSLLVKWRWLSVAAVFLVPFTLFWNGIMSVMAFGATENFAHPERLLFGLLIPHVWIGVGLAYYCVALFLNSTTVKVVEGTLHVKHGPLPWRGTKAIPVRELQQLFVVEKRGSKGSISYELCGLMRDGRRQSILTGLASDGAARFLEVRLEQVMNITDQAVEGELRR